MENKIYITQNDKKYIENYCKIQIENNDKIRVKSVAVTLSQKYALYEIMQYIKQDLGITEDKIWHGDADYIFKMTRGHVQIVSDLYFNTSYMHQYVICKELGLGIEQVKKYIIHHIDQDKSNNNIDNLWLFCDKSSHMSFHQLLKKDVNADIKEFNSNYIESILDNSNKEDIKKYLEVVDKLENTKKCA
ncbi:hypothetical protein HBE96_00360 [Clostridium sp. P21]|uniref:HNH nuclease domain-containing protein n=1 Tax=Clostridium muellerianum TaxID=2716538 RepID=A0A7Y0ECX8_9CLOT|nr:HNH endonuclease [Clostridium muellerianum]NMM61179.1 hypothetical protein [Clostridium muellerianum]